MTELGGQYLRNIQYKAQRTNISKEDWNRTVWIGYRKGAGNRAEQ